MSIWLSSGQATRLEETMKVQTLLRSFGTALFQAALLMALSVTAAAQITTTGIRGTVRDPNEAVVQNPTI